MRLLALLPLVLAATAFADPPTAIELKNGVEIAAGDPIRDSLHQACSPGGRLLVLPLYVDENGRPEQHSLLRKILAEVRTGVRGETEIRGNFWGIGGGTFLVDGNTRLEVLSAFLEHYAREVQRSNTPFVTASVGKWGSYFEVLLDVPEEYRGVLRSAQAFEHVDPLDPAFTNPREMQESLVVVKTQHARALAIRNLAAFHHSLYATNHPHQVTFERPVEEVLRSLLISTLKVVDAHGSQSSGEFIGAATVHALEAASGGDPVIVKEVLLQVLGERGKLSPLISEAVQNYPHPLVGGHERALLWNSVLPEGVPRPTRRPGKRCEDTMKQAPWIRGNI